MQTYITPRRGAPRASAFKRKLTLPPSAREVGFALAKLGGSSPLNREDDILPYDHQSTCNTHRRGAPKSLPIEGKVASERETDEGLAF